MIKKRTLFVLLLCIILCVPAFSVFASEWEEGVEYNYGYFYYTVKDGKVTITGYHQASSKDPKDNFSELVIPSKINGMRVVAASDYAFIQAGGFNRQKITSVVCSKYMTTVKLSWFSDMEFLEKITLGRYTKKFSQYAVRNRHNDPLSLTTIAVPEQAKYLKVVNGVLYSKDGTILWAYPAGSAKTAYRISRNTTTIAPYAFYGTMSSALKTLRIQNNVTSIKKDAFYLAFPWTVSVQKFPDQVKVPKMKVPKAKLTQYKKLLKKSGIDFNEVTVKFATY